MNPARPSSEFAYVQAQFIEHIAVIRGFIRSLVKDRHLADDVLQETFLTISSKADSFEAGTNFPRWACSVARFKVLEALRKQQGRMIQLSEEAIDALAASASVPDSDIRTELLATCIEELPPTMKRSITLRYHGDNKPAEIARIVGWTPESVYVALSKARTLLRDCIERKLKQTPGEA